MNRFIRNFSVFLLILIFIGFERRNYLVVSEITSAHSNLAQNAALLVPSSLPEVTQVQIPEVYTIELLASMPTLDVAQAEFYTIELLDAAPGTSRVAMQEKIAAPPMTEQVVSAPKGTKATHPVAKGEDNLWPLPKRLYLSHIDGVGDQSGISYGTDYATIQMLLAPDYQLGKFMYMIDLRGHRFDNNTYAGNVGLGVRYIPAKDTFCELLGLNTYGDWRQGFVGDYYQIGLGVEVLGKRWDLRANGYIPLGRAKNQNNCLFTYSGGYEIEITDCEFATYGFNAEVGYLAVKGKDFLLYMATGPYYLTSSSCCFNAMRGGEFRIRPQYKDYIAVEGRVSWDTVYKWVYQTEIILSLPIYQITHRDGKKPPCRITERQVYQPVERFEIMPLGRKQCWFKNF